MILADYQLHNKYFTIYLGIYYPNDYNSVKSEMELLLFITVLNEIPQWFMLSMSWLSNTDHMYNVKNSEYHPYRHDLYNKYILPYNSKRNKSHCFILKIQRETDS